jgi:hypothetical protein
MLSNRVRNANMSESALKMLTDHAPSKLRVAGSNPAGVANFPTNAGFHSDKIGTDCARNYLFPVAVLLALAIAGCTTTAREPRARIALDGNGNVAVPR